MNAIVIYDRLLLLLILLLRNDLANEGILQSTIKRFHSLDCSCLLAQLGHVESCRLANFGMMTMPTFGSKKFEMFRSLPASPRQSISIDRWEFHGLVI
jgi:hypothetical protein